MLTELRAWHKRGTLPYVNNYSYDYTAGDLAIIPILVARWSPLVEQNKIDLLPDLDQELVDEFYTHPKIEKRGDTKGERNRIAKLILDAAREVYHLAGLRKYIEVGYHPGDDVQGIDAHVFVQDIDIPIQISCQVSSNWLEIKKGRRKVRGVQGSPLVIKINPADTRVQPWCPMEEQYAEVAEKLRKRFEPFEV